MRIAATLLALGVGYVLTAHYLSKRRHGRCRFCEPTSTSTGRTYDFLWPTSPAT